MFRAEDRERDPASRVGMALFRIAQSIKRITQQDSDQAGLSPVQIQALLFIHHTRPDVATVGHLADAIAASHVTAVKLVSGLMEKGLVAKEKSTADRRVTFLLLTEQGRGAVSGLEKWGEELAQAVSTLSDDAMEQLERGLGGVVHALKQAGHLVVSEPCRGCIHFRPNAGEGSEPHYCDMIRKYLSHEASLKECPEHTKSM